MLLEFFGAFFGAFEVSVGWSKGVRWQAFY